MLFAGGARVSAREPDFITGEKITFKEFYTDYKKRSGLETGKYYTLYACVDGTVQLPFYKGVMSESYYYGSACYAPRQLYITDYDFCGLQKAVAFRHSKGMLWVTLYVRVDRSIIVVDFKQ